MNWFGSKSEAKPVDVKPVDVKVKSLKEVCEETLGSQINDNLLEVCKREDINLFNSMVEKRDQYLKRLENYKNSIKDLPISGGRKKASHRKTQKKSYRKSVRKLHKKRVVNKKKSSQRRK
jgi:hypothetical protein